MKYKKYPNRFLRHLFSGPLIWSILIPSVILDIWIEIYHRICFPLCGIDYVPRSRYIKIDRYKLSYLDFLEKIECTYCGYINGLFQYWTMIAAESEIYWCAIRHKKSNDFKEPSHHKKFVDYGSKKKFERKYPN
ncbi:hypothetical protein HOK68_04585 [Candidatus Woesearchaeota archaeon]|nr:hypothetical protein [Candidatus Woesearchaeota archaeon]MBT4387164.1 hypothetical protein [Candidatus Woesearchaeota archaeon]MBT4596079.1 hypothetical protein [Candidatus Woesearchaeota archaeon]MBT5741699.1 hypothetical protein [Candidatus Woesearchaeota archaeon]MBT6506028.1 hypothetical protein [Candidatus Woesearchaeota archaeon]